MSEAIQESQVIRAKYVLGCDGKSPCTRQFACSAPAVIGAHSWVRRAVNIPMEGEMTGRASESSLVSVLNVVAPLKISCGVSSILLQTPTSHRLEPRTWSHHLLSAVLR